jgi:hypothetical protein
VKITRKSSGNYAITVNETELQIIAARVENSPMFEDMPPLRPFVRNVEHSFDDAIQALMEEQA